MPESWDSYDWHSLESPKRLIILLFVYFLILLQDFNAFALKYILWVFLTPIPPFQLLSPAVRMALQPPPLEYLRKDTSA